MKKLILIALVLIMVLFPTAGLATEFNAQNIVVDLQENGDAIITNEMHYYDDEGTEHYIVMGNLGDSEIRDLQVSKNGVQYEILPEWDVDLSREEKSGKAGILDAGSHYEICFGIGEYGEGVFNVSYRITNAVKNLNDAQMFFFRLINDELSEAPTTASATIRGPQPFTEEDVRMWAFGYEGTVLLENGAIVLKSTAPFNSSNYMTPLVRFNPGYFNTSSNIDRDFASVLDEAFEGSDYDPNAVSEFAQEPQGGSQSSSGDDYESTGRSISRGIINFLRFIPALIVPALFLGIGKESSKKKNGLIKEKTLKDYYFRDIPFKGGIEEFYWIATYAGLTSYDDYMTAYFLKWIKEGIIEPRSSEEGWFIKKNVVSFNILKDSINKDGDKLQDSESTFFRLLKEASGDGHLDSKEFTKWLRKTRNQREFEDFISDLNDNSEDYLLEHGYLKDVEDKFLFVNFNKTILTDKGIELNKNLIGFRNYLRDYSLLNERQSVNVHIWDEYMIYAAIFGITEEVEKEFAKLYPNYETESVYYYNNLNTLMWVNAYSSNIKNSYSSATSSSSSSGFGGGSSMGGGGGSFGGGSGGGTR